MNIARDPQAIPPPIGDIPEAEQKCIMPYNKGLFLFPPDVAAGRVHIMYYRV